MSYDYPRLCGGTYFTLLLQALKQRTSARGRVVSERDGLSNPEVLSGLIRVVNPEFQIPIKDTFKTNTSDYMKCKISSGTYFPFDEPATINSFDQRIKSDYQKALSAMARFVNTYLEVGTASGKDVRLVKALIELIAADESIADQDQFYCCEDAQPSTKANLIEVQEVNLPAFLLGIWHNIMTSRKDNTIGAETYNCWHKAPLEPHGKWVFIGSNGTSITRDIWLTADSESVESTSLPAELSHWEGVISSVVARSTPHFEQYLKNAKEKYSTIKTLFYSDQPKPFYAFYVCNDIERKIPVSSKFETFDRYITIENVTVKSLTQCFRFVILAGTGGLGKSMMMRHLLLNSIESYAEMHIIPVFIPLKDFDENVDSLFDYAFSKITNLCGSITAEQFGEVLQEGKCLLLFDGLDEIGSTCSKRFERELEAFTDKYPENNFVISSRPYQTFISYSRFEVLKLKPFSKQQALMLIDNLEFRPDEPIIKEKFRVALNESLFRTHSTFIQNPLLLTIMLLTFEQYAEVPSKMHQFYREAFAALSVKHDANKGAYKRALKTGLTAEKLADYFAEFCSRSYHDEKFEITEDEFSKYFNSLKEREKSNDRTTTAGDFLYDLCSNICLMYFERGKYYFTHRSFQEYFCALYFSKQKDKNLESIGDFFENRHSRMYGDRTFNMMYDMIPDKVEEYIFLPFLTRLYERCDSGEGYWTFLETLYPYLRYVKGETEEYIDNDPQSYIYSFIKQLVRYGNVDCNHFPHYDSLVTDEYVHVTDDDECSKLVNRKDVDWEYEREYGIPDTVGWIYEFEVEAVRKDAKTYAELLKCLEDENFTLIEEYAEMREYLEDLQEKLTPSGNSLFDLFH